MNVVRLHGPPSEAVLAEARACVASGGLLIFPTDTVYGIGCRADDDEAVARIFDSKRRPERRPLSIHLADAADARGFAARIGPGARAIVRHCWPGPVTVIVQRDLRRASAAARGGPTIGLRCPDDATYRAIVRATGPLAATSANISGEAAFTGATDDLASLPAASMAIIAGPTKSLRESTVLDCSSDRIRILRAGALDPALIEAAAAGLAPVDI